MISCGVERGPHVRQFIYQFGYVCVSLGFCVKIIQRGTAVLFGANLTHGCDTKAFIRISVRRKVFDVDT